MTALPTPPSRVEQVYDAIVEEICTGRLAPGTPLRQELLAERFHVSRHPVQQALLLLKNHGLPARVRPPRPAGDTSWTRSGSATSTSCARCWTATPREPPATRISAEGLQRGHDLVVAGRRAAPRRARTSPEMITADVEFHRLLVHELGNPLLVESTAVIWRNVQRVMGEVHLPSVACPRGCGTTTRPSSTPCRRVTARWRRAWPAGTPSAASRITRTRWPPTDADGQDWECTAATRISPRRAILSVTPGRRRSGYSVRAGRRR